MKNVYCTHLERSDFEERLYDSIQEAIDYSDTYPENIGVSIEGHTLEVTLCTEDDCVKPNEWFLLDSFLLDGEVSAVAVLDLVDKFCFVI